MAYDKVIDSSKLDSDLTSVADAIRSKGGTSEALAFPAGFVSAIEAIEAGGGGGGGGFVEEKDIRFMDYDGTLLYSYSVDEFAAMTELPPLPEQKGLICQGWNWSLEDIKAMGRAVNVGAMYITDDGKTRIYITLQDGRTSPMLGVCPNGTVTVDWGDGSEPDVLTGTSTSTVQWTPNHEYGKAGDYVISLTVDGEMGFLGSSSNNAYTYILRYSSAADGRNRTYHNALQKIEIGDGVTRIGNYAFYYCHSLSSITIPDGVTSIGSSAFDSCYSLASIAIPDGVVSIGGYAFQSCCSLFSIAIPDGVTIGNYVFSNCYSLASIAIPDGVVSIGSSAFSYCYNLSSVVIPDRVTSINSSVFKNCNGLSSITIPDGVTSIGSYAFSQCTGLSSIAIPDGVTSIGSYAFQNCYGMKFYDFTTHTAVPTLSSTNAFNGIPADCEIRVPAALYDEWIAATNWATYAKYMVAV